MSGKFKERAIDQERPNEEDKSDSNQTSSDSDEDGKDQAFEKDEERKFPGGDDVGSDYLDDDVISEEEEVVVKHIKGNAIVNANTQDKSKPSNKLKGQ